MAKYVLENGERVFENGEHMLESGERLLFCIKNLSGPNKPAFAQKQKQVKILNGSLKS